MQTLKLENTKIGDKGLEALKGLTSLQTLYLDGTKGVAGPGLEQLKGLTKLQTLNLFGTKVNDAALAHLKPFAELRSLGLARRRLLTPVWKTSKG